MVRTTAQFSVLAALTGDPTGDDTPPGRRAHGDLVFVPPTA
jgi:hypothetical protein